MNDFYLEINNKKNNTNNEETKIKDNNNYMINNNVDLKLIDIIKDVILKEKEKSYEIQKKFNDFIDKKIYQNLKN